MDALRNYKWLVVWPWALFCSVPVWARSIFSPFPDPKNEASPFSLQTLESVPYRIQFKGLVEWKEGQYRYIFLMDNHQLCQLALHERSPYRFVVQAFDDEQQSVRIYDEMEDKTWTLERNKTAYYPDQFRVVLKNKQTGQVYHFSQDALEQSLSEGHFLKIVNVKLDKKSLLIVEHGNKRPYAYKLYASTHEQ